MNKSGLFILVLIQSILLILSKLFLIQLGKYVLIQPLLFD